jgi:hypothetical protein
MYYVKTETDSHTITSSYVTEKQARRYGGEPTHSHLRLMDDGFTAQIIDFHPESDGELNDIGQVRTIFESKRDINAKRGDFHLYLKDNEDDWYYTGISFASMSDANQAVKGPLSGTYGDMLIVQSEDIVMTSKEESQVLAE